MVNSKQLIVMAVVANFAIVCSETDIENRIAKLELTVANLQKQNNKLEEEVARLSENGAECSNKSVKRRLLETIPERVAFSTYMGQHSQQHIGVGQKLIFDQILLNEGNGYNVYLGTFQAPVDGIYIFSYFIGKSYNGEATVQLMKNGQALNAAIVDVPRIYEDHMGGNVAIVSLTKGDLVWIEEYMFTDISFNGDHRWTTFSGALLSV